MQTPAREPIVKKQNTPLLVLQVNRHEKELYNYEPDFVLNCPNFDVDNVPYIRSRTSDLHWTKYVQTLDNGKWIDLPFEDDILNAYPLMTRFERAGGWLGARIVFDKDNHAYTIVQVREDKRKVNLLLYSKDRCRSWKMYELPAGTAVIEKSSSPEPLPGPPAIVVWREREKHPARFCSWNVLSLVVPTKTDIGLRIPDAVEVSQDCFGYCMHSGGATFVTTANGKSHLVWGEALPGDTKVEGVPTYIATYDHAMGKMGEKVLMAYAPPVNDVHNAPGIVRDSQGYLHVITGAHGANFYYLRSDKPDDAYGGWSKPEPTLNTGWIEDDGTGERGRQTYLALLRDSQDTLHIAFRQWRKNVDKHLGGKYFASLSYQRKPEGGAWSEAKSLVAAPVTGYGIFYHKLAIDRRDNLYLSYSYFSHQVEPYKTMLEGNDKRYTLRSMMTSRDRGDTWDLAVTEDFLDGMK